ncbi:hypothetical protein DEV91_103162 [Phyllobacterium brassicacearum]|nr:hypothetical protein DEV91_103162 [Phyllobacterium brassicacearum]
MNVAFSPSRVVGSVEPAVSEALQTEADGRGITLNPRH